ncbi:MAG: DUF4159 domain-containing protein [Pirellulales bacterium]|nr:DUF4159 domain-containing protein [Pirellulales bacterium]
MQRCPASLWRSVLTVVVALRLITPSNATAADITAEQVRKSIESGVEYLKRTQNQNGTWNDFIGYSGGTTCLNSLALLTAGVSLDDEQLRRALEQVRKLESDKTYVVALQTMVLCMAEPARDHIKIRRNAAWLETSQKKDGGWYYGPQMDGSDPSNSQYAVLALYEAERAGVPVASRTWQLAERYWLKIQNHDGSWGYSLMRVEAPARGSMTCAGIASLVMCSGRLNAGDAEISADGSILKCCGNSQTEDAARAIENGLVWLGNNFSVQSNPGCPEGWHMYYMYCLERVGRMTSHRFFYSRGDFRKYDWYRMGAEMLVSRQDALSGYWKGDNRAEAMESIGTSFALLFLAKGRRPILVSKAKFGPGNDWNHHRSDIANLTTYVENRWKKEFPLGLSWQVVDVSDASVDDLLQAPVLYICGEQTPNLLNHAAKFREYIDRGGFVFADACCPNSAGFDQGFRALMEKVFEEPEYKLKPVPPEHPLWYAEEPVRPSLRPNLWSIDYGCRTCVVYSAPTEQGDLPHSLSCYWEVSAGRDHKLDNALKNQMQAALSMGINVLAYATNRELKSKDENFELPDAKKTDEDTTDRGKRSIAKLRHAGGCNAAPGALPALLRAASRELQARFSTEQRLVSISDPALFRYDVVFMHGRHGFKLSDTERKQLKKYLERGTLIADAICANKDFAAAFRREINALFADEGIKLETIPASHPMFTDKFGGFDLSKVTRREPQRRAGDGPLQARQRTGSPEIEGLKIGDRYAVLFSPYDLSCALEKHDSLECEGYTREDAERIGLNLLLYATFEF